MVVSQGDSQPGATPTDGGMLDPGKKTCMVYQFFEPFFEAHDLEKGGPMACRGVGGLRGRPGTDRDAEWLVLRTGEGTVDRHARR